jgi:hypothetical protein
MRRTALVLTALIVALFAAQSAEAAPPLIAQWPFNESQTSGTTDSTGDVSGNGLALTSAAGTMHLGTAEGKFGGYLSEANATTLEVSSPLLAPPQLTLLAWIKQSGNPGTLRYIAGRGDDGGFCGGSSYALYTGYNGNPGLHFYLRTPGPTAVPVLSEPAPDASVFDGNWHLVAGTYDGANMRFYVDGNEIGAPMPAAGISYEPPITGSSFYVDGYPPQTGCPDASDFPGKIDEVRLYDRALSPAELAFLAAAPGPEAPSIAPNGGNGTTPPPPLGPQVPPIGLTLSPPRTATGSSYSIFKVGTTGPVTETKLKINGSPAFRVDPSAPFVALNLTKPGSYTISATSFGTGGQQLTQTTPLTVPSGGQLKRPSFLTDTALVSSNVAVLLEALKNKECVPNSTVIFGVVEAQGCFRKINPATELPPAEKGVAEEYTAINFLIEHLGPRPCKFEDPTCHTDFSAPFAAHPEIEPFVSFQPVKVDGMTITPIGGASLVVFPAIQRVISSNAKITYDGSALGSIPVKSGPLNLDMTSGIKYFTSGNEELPLFSFNTSQAFKDIGGFPINGTVNIVLQKKEDKRSTSLKINLSLPEEISTAAGADPTAKVEVNADNQRGTYLGLLNIHMNEAFLGPVELANVDFTYNDAGEPLQGCSRKWWKATAEVFFLPGGGAEEGAGLKMAPEPQRNGVAFCAGDFHSAGADLKFGYPLLPPPEIFPGVTLNEIGFSFQLHEPVVFDGYGKIKSAELVTATGGFLAAFASPSHPYTFSPGDAGGSLQLLHGQTFTSTTVALGGKVEVEPSEGVNLELGSAYLLYSYPDYISAAGSAHLQTFLFTVNAGGSFELSTRTRRFNAVVHGEICLAGGIKVAHVGLCAGGEGHISSRGISVCFDLLGGQWTPGVGYLYGATFPEFFAGAFGDGCKPSHFWEVNVRGSSFAAARTSVAFRGRPAQKLAGLGAVVFNVKPGEEVKNVELAGGGGAPAVTVVAPDGEELSTEPNLMLHGKHLSLISADKYSRTWIGVEDAKPGVYKVIPQPGSPAIVKMRETHYEPEAGVEASVTGKGRHLVLHYDAGHAKGQTVSFFERGKGTWELLKKVDGGKGSLAFEPSFGPAGKRAVAAQVEVDGIPAPLETLAHFKAPPPPQASRVSNVRVVRHGSKLQVSWRKAPYTEDYSVVTEASGGAVRSQRVKAKRSAVTVKGIPATEAGRVEVVSFGPLGDRGKPGVAKFKALRKPTTRLLPFKELGSGASSATAKKGGKKVRSSSRSSSRSTG